MSTAHTVRKDRFFRPESMTALGTFGIENLLTYTRILQYVPKSLNRLRTLITHEMFRIEQSVFEQWYATVHENLWATNSKEFVRYWKFLKRSFTPHVGFLLGLSTYNFHC